MLKSDMWNSQLIVNGSPIIISRDRHLLLTMILISKYDKTNKQQGINHRKHRIHWQTRNTLFPLFFFLKNWKFWEIIKRLEMFPSLKTRKCGSGVQVVQSWLVRVSTCKPVCPLGTDRDWDCGHSTPLLSFPSLLPCPEPTQPLTHWLGLQLHCLVSVISHLSPASSPSSDKVLHHIYINICLVIVTGQ